MKRRDFLKGTVLTGGAGMILEACTPAGSEQVIPILIPEERFVPGVQEFLTTACFECPGGCGLLARKIDGRIVKIDGNPAHPISRGGSCARGQALPQALYHPDRIQQPLLRQGERGAGEWQPISWDQAIERLVSELSSRRRSGNAGSVAVLTGNQRGHRPHLVRRFLQAYGSPHHWIHEPFGDRAVRHAHGLATGVPAFFALDLEHTNYIVSFGAALLEGSRSPVRFGRGIGHMRRGRPGLRGKLVAVEPRLSLTASSADEWLPARPGTEAAVALALAHILLRDDLYDAEFIDEQTAGFEEFRDVVAPRFEPQAVAVAAGLSAEALERVAHEMADHRPTVAVAGDAAAAGPAGLATSLAVAHLNALLGAYGRRGGVFFDAAPPFAEWPELPEAAEAIEVDSHSFASWLATNEGSSADLGALLISGTNPVFSMPAALDAASAISAVPFVAAFATVLDETSMLADLVLPESTPLERIDDDVASPGVGVPVASLSQPVFSRTLYDTRAMPDVLIEVAAGLGDDVAAAFPWDSYEGALRDAWAGLQATGTGSVTASTAGGFWRRAVAAGGWWDEAVSPTAQFATPDGRYRFETVALAALEMLDAPASGEYPLTLQVYGSVALGDGRSAHLPFLQELADPVTGARWGTVVELNPETAAAQNIETGDMVELTSEHGELRAAAHVSPGLRPDVVAVAAGQGHTAYGRFASGKGASPYRLLAPDVDPAVGETALVTAVRLRRISIGA